MGGGANTFALHLIIMLLLPLWALFWSSILFFIMKLTRILRVSEASERRGVDFDHGEVSWGEYAADTIHNPFQPPPILVTPASDGGFVAQHVRLMPLHPSGDDESSMGNSRMASSHPMERTTSRVRFSGSDGRRDTRHVADSDADSDSITVASDDSSSHVRGSNGEPPRRRYSGSSDAEF